MQLIRYNRWDDRVFCPVTGQPVFNENMEPTAPTVRGVWALEVPEDPILRNSSLAKEWQTYMERVSKATDDGDDDVWIDPAEFLEWVNGENWVAFQIESVGIACGPTSQAIWVVFDFGMEIDKEHPRWHAHVARSC